MNYKIMFTNINLEEIMSYRSYEARRNWKWNMKSEIMDNNNLLLISILNLGLLNWREKNK